MYIVKEKESDDAVNTDKRRQPVPSMRGKGLDQKGAKRPEDVPEVSRYRKGRQLQHKVRARLWPILGRVLGRLQGFPV